MQSIPKKIILVFAAGLVGLVFFAVQPPPPPSEAQSDSSMLNMDSLEQQKSELCETSSSGSCDGNTLSSRLLLAEIDRKISILARKNLPLYALRKYAKTSSDSKKQLESAYVELLENDPKADVSPKYLLALGKRIEAKSSSLDRDPEFLAYTYIIGKLKESGRDLSELQQELDKALKIALIEIDKSPKNISFSSEEASQLEKVFDQIHKNAWNIGHLQMMKAEILRQSIGENTRFFRAYALAKMRTAVSSRFLSLGEIPHSKQKYALSCEVNSLTDLINYYRTRSGEKTIDEDTLLLMLPSSKDPISIVRSGGRYIRIWGDPDKEFVGSITGFQSTNPNRISGYGILADGILPLGKTSLKSAGLTLERRAFDQAEILASLYKGNPVVFWYVLGSSNRLSPSQLSWQTPEGKSITGYIGEHTGIITGAEMDENGSIVTLEFYEWQSKQLQKVPYEIVLREAKWFDSALYVENL